MATYKLTWLDKEGDKICIVYSEESCKAMLCDAETDEPVKRDGIPVSVSLSGHPAQFFSSLLRNPKKTLTYQEIAGYADGTCNSRFPSNIKTDTLSRLKPLEFDRDIIENVSRWNENPGYRLDNSRIRVERIDDEPEQSKQNDAPKSLLEKAREDAEARRSSARTRHAAERQSHGNANRATKAESAFTVALLHDALFDGAAFASWAQLDDSWQAAIPFADPQAVSLARFMRALLSDEAVAVLQFDDETLESLAHGDADRSAMGACFRTLGNPMYFNFAVSSAARFADACGVSYANVGTVANAVFAHDAQGGSTAAETGAAAESSTATDASAAARAFAEATYPQLTGKALVLLCVYALFGARATSELARQTASMRG